MFGYVTIDKSALSPEAVSRYESFYCGLCRTLHTRFGNVARTTLSYDMTFLLILLSSLYEPEETAGEGKCVFHPVKSKPFLQNEIFDYAADMNVVLAYYKLLDNWQDERKLTSLAQYNLLTKAYKQVEGRYPEKCAAIAASLAEIGAVEESDTLNVDALANHTANMLGEIYAYKPGDVWSDTLRTMGGALGRFIYVMDAYEDLPSDQRKKRYNPLVAYVQREDYEVLCLEGLSMLIAECADAFEVLPLVQDMDILRSVLYSGVWTRYATIQNERKKKEKHE